MQIENKFVKNIGTVEAILMNEVVDIDGWSNCPSREGKQAVTVLGGYLGQIIIILNAICKEFSHLDKPAGGKYKSAGARAS